MASRVDTQPDHEIPRFAYTQDWTRLNARSSSQPTHSSGLCFELDAGKIVIDRKVLIIAICICVLITIASILGVAALLYREWNRRRQAKAAKAWGRKSRVEQRISLMRKEIDNEYSRKYSGCMHQEPENPEMGSDSPIEIGLDDRVWEAPAVPARAADNTKRKSRVFSLFFDQAIGVWLPKQR